MPRKTATPVSVDGSVANTFAAHSHIQNTGDATMNNNNSTTASEIELAAIARKDGVQTRKAELKAAYMDEMGKPDVIKTTFVKETQYIQVPELGNRVVEFNPNGSTGLLWQVSFLAVDGNKDRPEPMITDQMVVQKVLNAADNYHSKWLYGTTGLIITHEYNEKTDFCQNVGYVRWNYTGNLVQNIEKLTSGDQVATLKVVRGHLYADKIMTAKDFEKDETNWDGMCRNMVNLMIGSDLLVSGRKLTLRPVSAHAVRPDGTIRQIAQEITHAKLLWRMNTLRAGREEASERIYEAKSKKIARITIATTISANNELPEGTDVLAGVTCLVSDEANEVSETDARSLLGKAANIWNFKHTIVLQRVDLDIKNNRMGLQMFHLQAASQKSWQIELK